RPVPARQGEHPGQIGHEVFSVLLVRVDEDLGVRLRRESMPALLQARAQLAKVVDLAVEDRMNGPRLVRDGLPPAGQIDDAEAGCTARGPLVAVVAPLVGAAMTPRRHQPAYDGTGVVR